MATYMLLLYAGDADEELRLLAADPTANGAVALRYAVT